MTIDLDLKECKIQIKKMKVYLSQFLRVRVPKKSFERTINLN